jgi:Holliday junction resolvase
MMVFTLFRIPALVDCRVHQGVEKWRVIKMGKGNNPKRPADSQKNHDNMVRYVANDLKKRGYKVLADHIGWPNGSPGEINGYIPDIIATSTGNGNFIMEVETCPSYADEHTREQLTAFSKVAGYTTYVNIPNVCANNGQNYDPAPDIHECLRKWGLLSVRVGTCDPFTGVVDYNK